MIHNNGAARSASPVTRAAIGFLAAAVAVLTFHAAAWELMHLFGRMPAPYPMRPTPPLGVPVIASLTFWGALYGIPFGIALPYLRRPLTLWGFGLGLPACLVGPPRGEGRADAPVSARTGHAHRVAGGRGRGQRPRVLPAADAADGEAAVAYRDPRLGDLAHREGDPPEHRVHRDLALRETVPPVR